MAFVLVHLLSRVILLLNTTNLMILEKGYKLMASIQTLLKSLIRLIVKLCFSFYKRLSLVILFLINF